MNRLARWSLIPLTALLLAGCGATASTAPAPTPEPTPISLADLDIASLLVQDGDLPRINLGERVTRAPQGMFDEMPEAEQVVNQPFITSSKMPSGVTVFLYERNATTQQGYEILAQGMSSKARLIGVGDQALMVNNEANKLAKIPAMTDIVFRRCHAVVYMRVFNADEADVSAYARRLDKRLQESVCE